MIWGKINFAIYIETNEEKFKNQGNFFFEKNKKSTYQDERGEDARYK